MEAGWKLGGSWVESRRKLGGSKGQVSGLSWAPLICSTAVVACA